MVKIYTDSASDLFIEDAERLGVGLFHTGVNFSDGDFPYASKEDAPLFYSKLARMGEIPKTSAVVPGDYLQAFEEAKAQGEELVFVAISSGLTNAQDAARAMREVTGYDRIYVVDSLQVSIPERLLVEEACRLRDAGKNGAEIKRAIERLRDRVKFVGSLAGLKHLQKSGRFPAIAGLIGGLMNIKPILALQDGKVQLLAKVRGHAASYSRLLKELESDLETDRIDPHFPICFSYTTEETICRDLMERAQEKLPIDPHGPYQIGPVLGTHIGPGFLAITYVVKEED